MKHLKTKYWLACLLLVLLSCGSKEQSIHDICQLIKESTETASLQLGYQAKLIEESGQILNPRTTYKNKIEYVPTNDWTSGFFPGSMWYMYDLTQEEKWKKLGQRYTEALDSAKFLTQEHSLGLIINSSYGNGYRITHSRAYREVIIQAARSFASRYRPLAGVIQSWDENRGWQGSMGWMCPVTIDSMMDLELLFEAFNLTGDSIFRRIAIKHANSILKNHYRADNSCYQVVDYDKQVGGIRGKCTIQGCTYESVWARGQAWGLYGFTVCYRATGDERYLQMAEKICHFLFTHKNMPSDLVPYWDFLALNIPNEPRDASAAAIIASALYELSYYKPEYKEKADGILKSLSGPAYRAVVGTNSNFILMHSVGSLPFLSEVDAPVNYADYYFLEALVRKKAMDCQ